MQCNKRAKLLVMMAGILLFNGVIQSYADDIAGTPKAGDIAQGAHDWANNCARCHNLRAPTEFTPDQWQVIMQHMRLQAGLTGQEARNVTAFLMAQSATTQASGTNPPAGTETSGTPVSAVPAASAPLANSNISKQKPNSAPGSSGQSGSAVYHQTCVACHGANGKGAVPGAPDFTSPSGPLKNSDAVLLERTIKGYQSPGSPMAMPARGGNPGLSNEDLKNALNYIRSAFGK